MGILSLLYTIYGTLLTLILLVPLTIIAFILHPLFKRKIWQKLMAFFSKIILKLLFVRIKITGKENIPKDSFIIAPNQLSHLDGVVVRAVINKDFFLIFQVI